MKPVANTIFVKSIEPKKQFLVSGSPLNYQVVAIGKDVSLCKKGDFVLFSASQDFIYEGEKIIVVSEDDIKGVKSA